jgi:surface carbohydrate biosynthesis protein
MDRDLRLSSVQNRSLFLPIESQARELDAKLLLGLVALERGWVSVIGEKNSVRNSCATSQPGVFLSHNARDGRESSFKRLKSYGHKIAVLDEEQT